MRIDIPYGRARVPLDVPDAATVLRPRYPKPLPDEKAAFREALRRPLGGAPLRERVGAADRVAIAISDITRPTPNERIVPWLLEEIAHVPRERIVVLNGTGSHRANTREELVSMLGREVVESVEIVNHDAFREEGLARVGTTSAGAPVLVNRRWSEATFRITTGFIEPHFFAGFSGGPKGVIPGLGGIRTIQALHSARLIGDPRSTWAVLDENPLHAAIREAVSFCPPHFLANVTQDFQRRITGVYAGDPAEAHRAGCREVAREATQAVDAPFDLVVSSNSGWPLDQNLYQTVKGMTAAARIVRPGGAILMVSECRDGLPDHGNFREILAMRRTPAEMLSMIESPGFEMHDQWEAQMQAMVQRKAEVWLHSSLPEPAVRRAMLTPAPDLQGASDALLRRFGARPRVGVLPEGPLTVPCLRD